MGVGEVDNRKGKRKAVVEEGTRVLREGNGRSNSKNDLHPGLQDRAHTSGLHKERRRAILSTNAVTLGAQASSTDGAAKKAFPTPPPGRRWAKGEGNGGGASIRLISEATAQL